MLQEKMEFGQPDTIKKARLFPAGPFGIIR